MPFSYPAGRLRLRTLRVLKGHMPDGRVIQNGATNCEVVLAAGQEYVFFAKLPSPDGSRLWPSSGTFSLGMTHVDKALLAEVESVLSPFNSTHP
jgi:hypothetical protein